MSAELLELRGSQTPRIMSVPEYHSTIGPQVVDLAAMAGLYLDPWQQLVVEHMFGRRENGSLSSSEVAVIVARQNGKGAIIEAATLAWLFLLDERLVVYTAHEVKTANETFLRIRDLIDGAPKLSRRCLVPKNSNGQQAIRTRSGQRLNFLARSSGSGRGFTAPRLVLDEAMFLDERHTAAMGPTMLAMKDPQVCYFSSAPRGEDLVLNAICDRGEARTSPRLSYFEWSASKGRKWDDREGWVEALPALGFRLTEEKVLEQLGICGGEQPFMREILSVREDASRGGPIPLDTWAARMDADSRALDPVAFAVDVSPDRAWSSISSSGLRADGALHVEVVDRGPGTAWLVRRIKELSTWAPCAMVVDAGAAAGSLLPDLAEAGIEILSPTVKQLGQATGAFIDLANTDGKLHHLGQQSMLDALAGARLRPLGDAFAWDRRHSSVDITPLVSATLAVWGFSVKQAEFVDVTQAIH